MADDPLDYERMMEDAMRGIARRALEAAARDGLPDDHHFYIAFRTAAEGVEMPAALRAQYPDEMTIVIQHRFWNLLVDDEAFEVELAFGGKRVRLRIPFAALTNFVDPPARFGLRFGAGAGAQGAVQEGAAPAPGESEGADGAPRGGEKVVSLDTFRRK
jgi:hypothetical protein